LDPYASTALEDRPREEIVVKDTHIDLPSNKTNSVIPTAPIPNPTFFPDRLWTSISPIFIIRHPAWTVPSMIRQMRKVAPAIVPDGERMKFELAYTWSREIFDAYRSYYKDLMGEDGFKSYPYPIVVDGTDLVNDAEGVMAKFCGRVGIDSSKVSYEWDPVTASHGPMADAFLGTLKGSSGVIKSDVSRFKRNHLNRH
jgi:hypothetical protein